MKRISDLLSLRFSTGSLFLLTVVVALAIPYFLQDREVSPIEETQLNGADKAILQQLRRNGLDIELFHMCGMGDLATFTIDETDDSEFHVTHVFIKDPNAVSFHRHLVKLPELRSLEISNFASLQLTVSYPGTKNLDMVKDAVARFMKLENDLEMEYE